MELSSSLFQGDPLNWNEPGTGAGVSSDDPYSMYNQQGNSQNRPGKLM